MRHRRGDVVWAKVPYSDYSVAKGRPVLVVGVDEPPPDFPEYIVAVITSNPRQRGRMRVPVSAAGAAGRAMGLPTDSVVRTDKLVTLHASLLLDRVGVCPIMDKVDAALREALGLR